MASSGGMADVDFWNFLWSLHGETCEGEGVVAHMSRDENFSGQVQDPIQEIVVTRRDKAVPLVV